MYSFRAPAPLPIACAYSIHRKGFDSAGIGDSSEPKPASPGSTPRWCSIPMSFSRYSSVSARRPICSVSSCVGYISEKTSTVSAR